MAARKCIFNWFESVRKSKTPKFITGLRGTGKTAFLLSLRDRLLEEGVPSDRIMFIDTEDPSLRRFSTHEQVIDHVLETLPGNSQSYVFIREAAHMPGPEVVIGTLAASERRTVFATSSSRRLLDQGLAGYFSTRLSHFEVLPSESSAPYTPAEAKARWNEIFLHDVLAPNRILEVALAGRILGWLSDNLGDPVSLRLISAAISPAHRLVSPHTVETYLCALEDSHLVEKAVRWDTAEESPQKTGYKYYFTDPQLRLARYGAAPLDEGRRMALNRVWLHLRHRSDEVFTASGTKGLDFITRIGSEYARWHVREDGSAEQVADTPAPAFIRDMR